MDLPLRQNGVKEGVARALSQACTYGMDLQKTFMQVHGKYISFPDFMKVIHRGMLQSSLTSGLVYTSYFTVFNAFSTSNCHPFASSLASFSSSIIKIPISNSMRVMQTHRPGDGLHNVFQAAKKIHKHQGVRGLYTGYGMSFVEDAIEMDLRIRFFDFFSQLFGNTLPPGPQKGFFIGALSGGIVAAITTPFDTIRANLAVQASSGSKTKVALNIFGTSKLLIKTHGPIGLFRGVEYRVMATGLKMALFYAFMEVL